MAYCTAFPFLFDLVGCDLETIVKALDEGQITSVSLVREYINRIHADNHAGLELRAVTQLVPEEQLLATAARMDATRGINRLSLLHGIPILLKPVHAEVAWDSIATGPELHLDTTAGTPALTNSRPKQNAPLVDRLVEAGLIVLGKGSVKILSGWYHPGMPGGWSPVGGQVRSAYGPEHEVSGSSTGCAVGISAGMCPIAIGVESNGSITAPADRAGILGFKPTHGLFSSGESIVPINHDFDTPGPMGKSAFDIAALLDVLVEGPTSYLRDLERDMHESQPLAIGVSNLSRFDTIDAEGVELYNKAASLLGHKVVKDTGIYIDGHVEIESDEDQGVAQMYKIHMKEDWVRYLDGCEGDMRTLGDIVAWHDNHQTECFHPDLPGQQCLVDGLQYDATTDAAKVEPAIKAAQRVTAALKQVFADKKLDAIVFPYENASHLSSASGFPAVSVPCGMRSNGRPFGVVFIAPFGQDSDLLRVIRHCERVLPPRPVPNRQIVEDMMEEDLLSKEPKLEIVA